MSEAPLFSSNATKDCIDSSVIVKSDIEYRDYYIIDSDFHNENNSLTYVIEGNNYLDKDYLVSIEVKKGNITVYGRGKRVNGLLLNEGYNLVTVSELLYYNDIKIEPGKVYSNT